MNNKFIIAAFMCGSLLTCATQGGQPSLQPSSFSAGLGISTLGIGGSVGYSINSSFTVRGVVNYFKFNKKFSGDNNVDAGMRLFTIGILGDWHFLQNGFRLTGGLLYNGNELNIKATPNSNQTINGRVYTPQQIGTVKGTVNFRPISPYLGMGYASGHESHSGFSFNTDVGVLFQGSARGKIKEITGLAANGAGVIEAEKDLILRQINKQQWIKTYPVISLGISYKF